MASTQVPAALEITWQEILKVVVISGCAEKTVIRFAQGHRMQARTYEAVARGFDEIGRGDVVTKMQGRGGNLGVPPAVLNHKRHAPSERDRHRPLCGAPRVRFINPVISESDFNCKRCAHILQLKAEKKARAEARARKVRGQ